uniref:Uncharacterized protein n=1 Tax=Solanum tuberosum TaxID=4113 RepID=M1DK56_SOLTU
MDSLDLKLKPSKISVLHYFGHNILLRERNWENSVALERGLRDLYLESTYGSPPTDRRWITDHSFPPSLGTEAWTWELRLSRLSPDLRSFIYGASLASVFTLKQHSKLQRQDPYNSLVPMTSFRTL